MKIFNVGSTITCGSITSFIMAVAAMGVLWGSLGCSHAVAPESTRNIDYWPKVKSPLPETAKETAQVRGILAQMSLEEKVGQILQAEIQSVTADDIKNYHLGSILNGGGSTPSVDGSASAQDWVDLADRYYQASMDVSDGGVAIPIIWGTDAVHGHNNLVGATLFPHNIGLGATRNVELITRIGEVTAREVRATGIDWVFAPTLAVVQNDLWGRTYESYSEDPALVSQYAEAMVEGLQGKVGTSDFLNNQHVLACAKHYIGDGGTFGGDDQGDTQVNEETLVAIHNAGYPAAIGSGVQSIMSSFSSWQGEKLHGHHYLLTDVLRGQMGFDGLVVGDWNGHGQLPGCTNDSCAAAINAGVDLIMVPTDWRAMYLNTLAQVRRGEISMARLDEAVSRILRVKLRGGLFDGSPSARMDKTLSAEIGSAAHRSVARQAVRESLVLLKNNNGILPLKPRQRVLVAGDGADNIPMQSGGWSVTWQGTGVNNDHFPGATSIYAGIKQLVDEAGGQAILAANGSFDQVPDVAIVVFGEQPYAEGHGDRDSLEFEPISKSTSALLKKLQGQGIPVVAVFLSGRPLWVNSELNAADAFVAAWLPGSEGAGVADVIFRQKNGAVANDFKGRLSFSWPAEPLQTDINGPQYQRQPLFKLGYGLDYTQPHANLTGLAEDVPGLNRQSLQDIAFYNGRTLPLWNIAIRNREYNKTLSGPVMALPSGDVSIQKTDKDLQEDALRFTWKDAWTAGLVIRDGPSINLTPYLPHGIVSFDLDVKSFPSAALNIELICGSDCSRKVSLSEYAKAHAGKGWHNIRIPLSCFAHDGDNLGATTQPFNVDAGGTGEIEIANVRIAVKGDANITCADYRTLSITPTPQQDFWAVSWWGTRHEEVLKKLATGNPQLLMIGDSITQGWEVEGKDVWQKYYTERNAVNLGFSGDRTEHVLWRLRNGELTGIKPKLAVLMIGTNNTGHRMEKAEFTAAGIQAILAELKQRLPDTKILLLGIFPREAEVEAPMRKINAEINRSIMNLADNKRIFYLDIGGQFLTADGVLEPRIMPDLLHLNALGYRLWAEAMEPTISRLLGE